MSARWGGGRQRSVGGQPPLHTNRGNRERHKHRLEPSRGGGAARDRGPGWAAGLTVSGTNTRPAYIRKDGTSSYLGGGRVIEGRGGLAGPVLTDRSTVDACHSEPAPPSSEPTGAQQGMGTGSQSRAPRPGRSLADRHQRLQRLQRHLKLRGLALPQHPEVGGAARGLLRDEGGEEDALPRPEVDGAVAEGGRGAWGWGWVWGGCLGVKTGAQE